ncbi:hypothetical protein [Streptomyces sp. NPDC054794]
MGVGRFVYTPILPLMHTGAGLSATDGANLARPTTPDTSSARRPASWPPRWSAHPRCRAPAWSC